MATIAKSSQHHEALEETAARLIHILGLDNAIYACRSNYWHGVLRFVLAYKTFVDQQPRPHGFARRERNAKVHAVLQTVTQRDRLIPNAIPPAIAA